jgi:hypothetical protein
MLSRRRRERDEDYELAAEERSRGGGTGWLIAGLVAVGLGALAWYYLGPDLRRYLKIERM